MNREKKIIQTSIVGIVGNVFLVAAKAFIGFLVGSVSIILDAINNLTDALSSVITIIGTKLSNKKPDKKHPYGHGRVEYITSLVIAVIILVAGGSAIYESVLSLIKGKAADYSDNVVVSLVIISVAIVGKVALGLFFMKRAKALNSDALKGSGIDALYDALLSTSTLIGAIVLIYSGVSIEGYLGIVIGLFIIKSGVSILRESLSNIIGERTSKEVALGIKHLVCSFPEVIGAYDLILNNYGPSKAIGSIHIEVSDEMTAKDIHPLSRKIAAAVYMEYGVILTVGIYATNTSNPEITKIRKLLYELVKNNKLIKQVHGFYVDESIQTISFDIVIDFEAENPEKIRDDLIKELSLKHPEYQYFVVIDNDYAD